MTGLELIKRKQTLKDFVIDQTKEYSIRGKYMPIDKNKHANTFGKWKVTIKGDMEYDNGRYFIRKERLSEGEWIAHLFEKAWIDWNEFIPAYFQAMKNANIQFVTSRVCY